MVPETQLVILRHFGNSVKHYRATLLNSAGATPADTAVVIGWPADLSIAGLSLGPMGASHLGSMAAKICGWEGDPHVGIPSAE